MKIDDLLNNKHIELSKYLYTGDDDLYLTIRFKPNYWAKEKDTKYPESYDITDDSNDDKPILEGLTRENLEHLVSEIKDFLKIMDTKVETKKDGP